MKLSIFGSSEIIYHHIKAAKKNSFEIFSICTSNKKSKNIKFIANKFRIKNIYYDWKSFVKKSYENDCSVLIAGRLEDNEKVLTHCLKYDLKVLIEKPVFNKARKFDEFFKYKKNIFVGYNRIYYKSILELKKIILNEAPQNISIKCPETNIKNIALNTCHIISILYHLFGKIILIKKIRSKNSIFCIFKSKKKIPVFININFGSPDNFSFELNFKKKRVLLSPMEKLSIYNKLNKNKYKKNNIYTPNTSKIINEYKLSNIKPGFDLQYSNFSKFVNNQNNIRINIIDAKKIISICNTITYPFI